MLWPLSMVSRTTMRAVAWPGVIWSSWMPRWREARSASYILAAERWARAWGSSGTRSPRGLGLRQTMMIRLGWRRQGGGRDQGRGGHFGEGWGMVLAEIQTLLLDEAR